MSRLTDPEAADLLDGVAHSAEAALSTDELADLQAVIDHLRAGPTHEYLIALESDHDHLQDLIVTTLQNSGATDVDAIGRVTIRAELSPERAKTLRRAAGIASVEPDLDEVRALEEGRSR